MSAAQPIPIDVQLADEFVKYHHDPLGFVMFAYPWGEPGVLEQHAGPDEWQTELLKEIGTYTERNKFNGVDAVKPLRVAISSGHGIGKSTLVAWIVNWIMCTRPFAQGTLTANTFKQLETKTWAQVQKWTKLCIASHWFKVTDGKMFFSGYKENWFCSPLSCKEENSEAFAGQHAASSTSFYIFDEASAVPDKIYEVAEGGLTDGEPMIFMFGNPTRSSGNFYQAVFGADRNRWLHKSIDSRTSRFSNKEQIEEWQVLYGDDSDWFRVRVLGLAPRASDAQFIDMDTVLAAQKRTVQILPDERLVAGADLAWGGSDDNVIRFRCGGDARSIKAIRIKGEFTRDPAVLTNRLSDVLTAEHLCGDGRKRRVSMLFLDSAGIAGPVAARLRGLGHKNVMEVNFGADSPDTKYAYMRDFMWGAMKEWLLSGAIDQTHTGSMSCSHCQIETDLVGPGMVPDRLQRVKLEPKEAMKKRGVDSPDDGDALALTFAHKVAVPALAPLEVRVAQRMESESNPNVDMSLKMVQANKILEEEKNRGGAVHVRHFGRNRNRWGRR